MIKTESYKQLCRIIYYILYVNCDNSQQVIYTMVVPKLAEHKYKTQAI